MTRRPPARTFQFSKRPTPDALTPAPVGPVVTDADTGPGPVVVDADAATPVDLQRLRDLSHLLDDSIRVPGTDYRIGIEPLIGLLPVVGDAVGVAISAYVLAVAARSGVPRATVARVAFVLWLDAVVGSVPLVGDLFDAYWKANLRATHLLEARLADPPSVAADRRYLRRLAVVAVALTLAVVAVLVALAWWLVTALG
ncbi:DUF4112 domain-containing protein [Haloplanus salinus]|uniref:DUF4112 domain-containing protein n=1 Tax=Haloplanus salinus TaxID=1126245 RepID=A0A368N8G8_9EURY|nr:DUF4112 domain-containing protein [Haloplanus salinus]